MKCLQILYQVVLVVGLLREAISAANGSRADGVYWKIKADPEKERFIKYGGLTFGDQCKIGGALDQCAIVSTIVVEINRGTENPNDKRFTIISDLTSAWACIRDSPAAPDGHCKCAEEESEQHVINGRKMCIKAPGSLNKGDECIHTAECGTNLACVIDATMPGAEDIEDTRRYCSTSSGMIASIAILVFAAVLSLI